ncbi:MAG: acetylglutamate kinase [Candidatus Sulfobium sp.]
MEEIIKKAEILIDALPYIRNFYGKTFVVKYGGAAQTQDDLKESFAKDIVMLNFIGIRTVIVHGGGPRISATMQKMGKKPEFVHGQRVTDRETMEIVEMVLGGLVNKEIVALINKTGGKAVGLSGKDGGLIAARKKTVRKITPETGVSEIVDMGLVGEVTAVAPAVIGSLQRDGFIPVISPIGAGPNGETLNINADLVAAAIAGALEAEKLILLTDVPGLLDKTGSVMSTLTKARINRLIKNGTITGGMLPKVSACLEAVSAGVSKTHIVDGRIPHCLLLEIFTKEGVGTEIVG